ncbi:lysophospholipid acyltransferase family protein [Clostridium gasigenes]|uniref:1-acyl-sn-glycerol-3-phosphate acyltransferase n=1 Tax=Clostridium gasigenes TaxID=94869 RepID=A0A7X0VQU5_9CLOT|nr:lysophospholipid acyltransferase family protein [Clostridium gasigenes]MBB6714737.1 1-acyl-sn-glycerol-3-phosphate acyltransferase [Clostridium gasigenes]MBU3089865.1 1-acyl-sn-glycerol-3-phosphate acyltransferase [Clostridium gasigenes]
MDLFKKINYGLYMIILRLKAIKLFFIRRFKGEVEADKYVAKVECAWADYTINKAVKMNVTVIGEENIPDEPCVFIGNHTSVLDCPLLIFTSKRSIGFIAKKELIKVPIIGYWIKQAKCVPIDRENVREAVKVINEGVQNLKEGHSMAVFPEGTRSKDGKLGEFKRGSMKLATKAKVPIIPVAMDRADRAFEIDRKIKQIDIIVTFGEPIYTNNLTKEEEKELAEKVRSVIANSLEKNKE